MTDPFALPPFSSWLLLIAIVAAVCGAIYLVDLWHAWRDSRQWEAARRREDALAALERMKEES